MLQIYKPSCLLCWTSICNDSMRPGKWAGHLKSVHPEHAEKPFEYLKHLKKVKDQTEFTYWNVKVTDQQE